MLLKISVQTRHVVFLASVFMFLLYLPTHALEVKGKVQTDTGKPLAGQLLTDGISWSESDENGLFTLTVRDGQRFVILHEATGFKAARRYIPVEEEQFTFICSPTEKTGDINFIHYSDAETAQPKNLLPNLTKLSEGLDFILNTGDICRFPAIANHAKTINSETMGIDVFYTVGNHDIVAPLEDGSDYQTYLGPYWYSFERKGVMFVALPMNYGDVAIPYDLKDFGDWFAELLQRKQKINYVLIGHALLGAQMPPLIATHSGKITFDERFLGYFYGHWHLNSETSSKDSKAKAYCVSPPHFGGIYFDPPCYRLVNIKPDGSITTRLVLSEWHDGIAYEIKGDTSSDGNLTFICELSGVCKAVAKDGSVKWEVPSNAHSCAPDRCGTIYENGIVYAGGGQNLKAIKAETGEIIWRNTEWKRSGLFRGNTLTEEVIVSGAQWGGIFALDRHTGKLLWSHYDNDKRFVYANVIYSKGFLWSKGLKKVYKIVPKSGEIVKVYDIEQSIQNPCPVALTDELLLVPTVDGGIHALNIETSEIAWVFNEQGKGLITVCPYKLGMRDIQVPMYIYQDWLYACFLDGFVYKISLKDGKAVEKHKIDRPVLDAPNLVDGKLVFKSADGLAVIHVPINEEN